MNEDNLHAADLGANDLQLLWIAQGSKGAGITMPSGLRITKPETWERLLRESAEMNR